MAVWEVAHGMFVADTASVCQPLELTRSTLEGHSQYSQCRDSALTSTSGLVTKAIIFIFFLYCPRNAAWQDRDKATLFVAAGLDLALNPNWLEVHSKKGVKIFTVGRYLATSLYLATSRSTSRVVAKFRLVRML